MPGYWELGSEEKLTSVPPTLVINGTVFEADNALDARLIALAATAPVVSGMLRTSCDVDRVTTLDGNEQGDFAVSIGYGLNGTPEEGEVRFSASTKGGRETITQGLAVFDSVGIDPTHPAPDTGLAIGVDGDGNVNGVEVPVPKSTFSFEVHVDFSVLDDAYWTAIEDATGCVNDRTFYRRPKHSVRFLGCDFDGTIRLGQEAEQLGLLRFDFEREREYLYVPGNSSTGVTIPGLERPVSKRGFDYLDIQYGEFIDPVANMKVMKPIGVKATQVAPEFNFNLFGIGS